MSENFTETLHSGDNTHWVTQPANQSTGLYLLRFSQAKLRVYCGTAISHMHVHTYTGVQGQVHTWHFQASKSDSTAELR